MKITSRNIIAMLALLVYSGSAISMFQDRTHSDNFIATDEQGNTSLSSLSDVKHYHLLPNSKTQGFLSSNYQRLYSSFGSVVFADLGSDEIVWQQYFLASRYQAAFGLPIRDIIYPFHYHW